MVRVVSLECSDKKKMLQPDKLRVEKHVSQETREQVLQLICFSVKETICLHSIYLHSQINLDWKEYPV